MTKHTNGAKVAKPAKPANGAAAEWLAPSQLKPWKDNPRKNDGEPVERVVESIKRFGFGAPIVARKANREIIAGHTRWKAAKKLGLERVPVRMLDISEKDAHVLALADNRFTELTPWDDTLSTILAGFEMPDAAFMGWTAKQIGELAAELQRGQEVVEDEVPEAPKNPVTKLGDVWTLGRHRVVCGDCTRVAIWETLGPCDAVFTSPPYALESTCLRESLAAGVQEVARDTYVEYADTAAEWLPLMRSWMDIAVARAACCVVDLQILAHNKRNVLVWWNEYAERFSDVVVWDKQSTAPSMNAGVLNSRFEMLIVFGAKGANRAVPYAQFRGTLDNVYSANAREAKATATHRAVFPVHLPGFVMRDLCGKAKTWCDPFLGSGTTIIAAEQLNRACYGIELSPAYCDVIVERWQNLTGKKATRDGGRSR